MSRLHPGIKVLTLWFATLLVHLWLIYEAQLNPQTAPFNDVNLYSFWVDQMNQSHSILGVNAPWVYPFAALGPVLLAKLMGGSNGLLAGWLLLIGLLNAIGLSAIVDWGMEGKKAFRAAGFYLLFIATLGPVVIGRIDSVATFLAMLGLVQVYRNRLRLAMIFFTLGAWIKIWPIAAAVSIFTATQRKLNAVLVAVITSASVLALGFAFGGDKNLWSFVTMQGNRGIQVEAPIATFWLWASMAKVPGAGIYFDNQLVTNQVTGPFVNEVSALMGAAMAVALAITLALGLKALRAGADQKPLFAIMLLTATLDLIVFNKVGSPQFEGWLAVPIMAGLLFGLPSWRVPIFGGLTIALLTNLVYPVFYTDLMGLGSLGVGLLSLRNAALIGLLVWANIRLSGLSKPKF
jgi:hypothetical protein